MTKQTWEINDNSIVWNVKKGESHSDNIEMSGLYCDLIVYYGTNETGSLTLSQKCYFPTLRTIPNDTHATFCFSLTENDRPCFMQNGKAVTEHPISFCFDGIL